MIHVLVGCKHPSAQNWFEYIFLAVSDVILHPLQIRLASHRFLILA